MAEFSVLGPLTIQKQGHPVDLRGSIRRSLCLRLLASANQPVTADRLIEDVWDGQLKGTTLHSHIRDLRRCIDRDQIHLTGNGYMICIAEGELDAAVFEVEQRRGTAALGAGDATLAADLLGTALGRWRGTALVDVSDAVWAEPEITRLEELRLNAVEGRMDALLALGHHTEVVVAAEEAVRVNPLREALWERLIRALYRCERQPEALRAFQRARAALAEVGLRPSPGLVELDRDVLDRRPELAYRPVGGESTRRVDDIGAAMPTGTITLLFTDVEGSTRMWEANPETMNAALAHHDELVRAAVREHGGHVFKTVGDAFCVAFTTAADATRAAVAVQRAMSGEEWPEHFEFRVRIALHTGECERRDGDYFGLALNRASRLVGIAHGGQVLLTRLTAELVRGALPANVTLKDLGILRLRDLGHPDQVFQLQVPGLVCDFPPVVPVQPGVDEIPAELTHLIGRGKLSARVLEEVAATRLVTMRGPGGVGKTRLAIRIAGRARQPFDDGVRFVDLSVVHGDGSVADVILSSLHGSTTAGESPDEAVLRVLRPARALLLIDNCEHLLEQVRSIVSRIMQECRWVHVLVTSRQALGLQGEHCIDVPPLEMAPSGCTDAFELQASPAVRLFVLHAQMVDSQFAVSPHHAVLMAEICRRLDGIPLAIELAARQLEFVTLEQLAEEAAEERILPRLIDGTEREERQNSVAASLRWSFDLLSRLDQDLFLALGTFAGTFTREQALELFDSEVGPDLAHCFDRLVRLSMVTRDGPGSERFRLFVSSREFGQGMVSPAEAESLCARHAALMLRSAETFGPLLRTDREAQACQRLSADFPDHRQAVLWSLEHSVDAAARMVVALYQFCQFHLLSEVHEWALRLTELMADDAPLTTQVWGVAAMGSWFAGDVEGAIGLAERAIRTAPSPRDPSTLWAHVAMVDALGYSGRVEHTAEHFAAVVAYSRQSGDLFWMVYSLGLGAIGGLLFGDLDQARERADRAVVLARELNNPDCTQWAMHCLGRVLIASGELDAARVAFEEAMNAAGGVGSRWNVSLNLVEWCSLQRQRGDLASAAQGLLELLDLLVASGNRSQLSQCYLETAHVLAEHGNTDDAFKVWTARSGMPAMPLTPGASDEDFTRSLEAAVGTRAAALRVKVQPLTEGELAVLCRSSLEAVVQKGRSALDHE
jgi:predicted ATPase/class 3 adenylate cyclase